MTIQQLITKLKIATNIPWSYEPLNELTLKLIGKEHGTAYRLIPNNNMNVSIPSIITEEFITPILPNSFEAKELIDGIITNLQYENIDIIKELTKNDN